MINFLQEGESVVSFKVDSKIYSERIVSKVLYWAQKSYNTHWEMRGEYSFVSLIKKQGKFNSDEVSILHEKLSQDFIDFKTREIVHEETKDIRNILLIKAFANNDIFEDQFLQNESPN